MALGVVLLLVVVVLSFCVNQSLAEIENFDTFERAADSAFNKSIYGCEKRPPMWHIAAEKVCGRQYIVDNSYYFCTVQNTPFYFLSFQEVVYVLGWFKNLKGIFVPFLEHVVSYHENWTKVIYDKRPSVTGIAIVPEADQDSKVYLMVGKKFYELTNQDNYLRVSREATDLCDTKNENYVAATNYLEPFYRYSFRWQINLQDNALLKLKPVSHISYKNRVKTTLGRSRCRLAATKAKTNKVQRFATYFFPEVRGNDWEKHQIMYTINIKNNEEPFISFGVEYLRRGDTYYLAVNNERYLIQPECRFGNVVPVLNKEPTLFTELEATLLYPKEAVTSKYGYKFVILNSLFYKVKFEQTKPLLSSKPYTFKPRFADEDIVLSLFSTGDIARFGSKLDCQSV